VRKTAKVRYEAYVLINDEEQLILESEDLDHVMDRIRRIAESMEFIAANIPSPSRYIPIQGFRINVSILEGEE
jgi:SepF-like predicted cell division protein (DUF552 family)